MHEKQEERIDDDEDLYRQGRLLKQLKKKVGKL